MTSPINRIFYLDDDTDDHFIFSLVVNEIDRSIIVISFYSCNQLIDYLQKDMMQSPDLIVMDQNIEGNRENECLQYIKSLTELKTVPVVIYTTAKFDSLYQSAMLYGAYKYLLKSATPEEIRSDLAMLIEEINLKRE